MAMWMTPMVNVNGKFYTDELIEIDYAHIPFQSVLMPSESKIVRLDIEKYGNTTSGTIPLCIWEWEKKLKKGDNIILAAFGGGFTWGSVYLKWAY